MTASVPSLGVLVMLLVGAALVLGIVVLIIFILRSGSGKAFSPPPIGPWQQDAEVRGLISAGKKIEAIKLVRNRYRMGLKEAKECVESLERPA